MSLPITSIRPVGAAELSPEIRSRTGSGDFGSFLEKAIAQTESSRNNADNRVQRLLGGESEELHSVVMATQRAELEFELLLQVRNKVLQAYQEIMRMQI